MFGDVIQAATQVLNVVTFATTLSSILVGVILGVVWAPLFERALGVAHGRRVWATFWGIEVPGATMLLGVMVARYLDGGVWPAWLGLLILWTIMATAAGITRRLA